MKPINDENAEVLEPDLQRSFDPETDTSAAEFKKRDAEPISDPTRHRVLVVVDDDVIRHLVSAALEAGGNEVVQAANGFEARQLVERMEPKLMVLDVNVSRPNAIEVLRALQFQIKKGMLAVLGLIMPGEADLEERCRELGVGSFQKEPFDLNELRSSVSLLLQEAS